MISTIDSRPPDSFSLPQLHTRSNPVFTDAHSQQPIGGSTFTLNEESHEPFDIPYTPTQLHLIDDHGAYPRPHRTPETVSNTAFAPSQADSLSLNGRMSNPYYDQNNGRYQIQTTNSGWNIQQSGAHTELDAVSPSSATPGVADYDGHGRVNHFTEYNNTDSGSEAPHQTMRTPIKPRDYHDTTGDFGPYSFPRREAIEHNNRAFEDPRYRVEPEDWYQESSGFTQAENDALSLASKTTAHNSIGSIFTRDFGDYATTPLDNGLEIRQTDIDLSERAKDFQEQVSLRNARFEALVSNLNDRAVPTDGRSRSGKTVKLDLLTIGFYYSIPSVKTRIGFQRGL